MQWGEDACWFSLKCDQKIALSLPYWGRGFAGTPAFDPPHACLSYAFTAALKWPQMGNDNEKAERKLRRLATVGKGSGRAAGDSFL